MTNKNHYQFLPRDSWEAKLLDLALEGIEEQCKQQAVEWTTPENVVLSGQSYSWHGLVIVCDEESINVEVEDVVDFLDHHGLPVTHARAMLIARENEGTWHDPEHLSDPEEREAAINASMRKESPYG